MGINILLGLQWGDEGKGKVVDVLAPQYEVVARFQGGPNAGHTLEFEGHKHVLHQIPSGIFHEGTKNVIGNGVVLDPIVFQKELEKLKPFNIDLKEKLFISKKAHLILPTHKLLDKANEEAKGKNKIGSTQKGIGPTYKDKIGRQGLRVGDILLPNFEERYNKLVKKHKKILKSLGAEEDITALEKEFFEAIDLLKSLNLINGEYFLNRHLKAGKTILAEGAQGSLLDIDFGSYPYVTSSNTIATGACAGLGVAPKQVGEVFGIFKAYCTRVGSGPFPTEQENNTGKELRKEGNEYGATTGRERRCGWLDLPALKYAIMLNGVTQLFMMKADVLSIFDEINICTHYKLASGEITEELPYDMCQEDILPIYKTFQGWKKDISSITDFDELPESLKQYIQFVEEEVEVPITIVSIGPDRKQTIKRSQRLVEI